METEYTKIAKPILVEAMWVGEDWVQGFVRKGETIRFRTLEPCWREQQYQIVNNVSRPEVDMPLLIPKREFGSLVIITEMEVPR
jgi:hypothetical protein